MIRINPVVKTAYRVLQTQINHKFAGPDYHLDPRKHITMGKYNHIGYIDQYDIGQYPQVIINGSLPPRTYQPKVQSIVLQTLNNRYNVSINIDEIINKKWNKVFRKIGSHQNINDILHILLNRLASEIIVKQSKWTWIKQQKQRLQGSQIRFVQQSPQTLQQFLNLYNQYIQQLVLLSHFGFSRNIVQPMTPQQRQVHNDIDDTNIGIQALSEQRPQNRTWINKMMRYLHS